MTRQPSAGLLHHRRPRNSNGATEAAPLRVCPTLATWKTGKVCNGFYTTCT